MAKPKKPAKTKGPGDFAVVTEQFARMAETPEAKALRRRQVSAEGPRILMATGLGGYNHGAVVDAVLSQALSLRGARVDLLLCDGFLPGCQIIKLGATPLEAFARGERSPRCGNCFSDGMGLFHKTGLEVLKYSQLVTTAEREAVRAEVAALPAERLATYSPGGVPAGEHALAGALRYFARGNLDGEAHGEDVLRRYLEAALLTGRAMDRLLDETAYDVVVAHHGIYVPQGLVVNACQRRGVRVVTWNPAYRKHCFIFSHGDTYHHTMVREPVEAWADLPWDERLDTQLGRYLQSRWYGTEDWIWFHSEPQHDIGAIAREVGFSVDRPVVTLLSNVVWDAQLHYPSNAFRSMGEWVSETIRYFARRPELQLVIRIHPAEIRGFVPSRQPLEADIRAEFSELPPNVYLVPPTSDVSTYALCEASNAVLIYNTKTGMEVTAKGIPTIVAGEAWIRGKGFARDPMTPGDYFAALDALPFAGRMSAEQVERARKYAYHIFFRRMIPLPFLKPLGKTSLSLEVDGLADLAPGKHPGLDVICDGILNGDPFIFPDELYAGGGAEASEGDCRLRMGGSAKGIDSGASVSS